MFYFISFRFNRLMGLHSRNAMLFLWNPTKFLSWLNILMDTILCKDEITKFCEFASGETATKSTYFFMCECHFIGFTFIRCLVLWLKMNACHVIYFHCYYAPVVTISAHYWMLYLFLACNRNTTDVILVVVSSSFFSQNIFLFLFLSHSISTVQSILWASRL